MAISFVRFAKLVLRFRRVAPSFHDSRKLDVYLEIYFKYFFKSISHINSRKQFRKFCFRPTFALFLIGWIVDASLSLTMVTMYYKLCFVALIIVIIVGNSYTKSEWKFYRGKKLKLYTLLNKIRVVSRVIDGRWRFLQGFDKVIPKWLLLEVRSARVLTNKCCKRSRGWSRLSPVIIITASRVLTLMSILTRNCMHGRDNPRVDMTRSTLQ